eukprot:1139245-Pelagomonas_calceolata.AAC.8
MEIPPQPELYRVMCHTQKQRTHTSGSCCQLAEPLWPHDKPLSTQLIMHDLPGTSTPGGSGARTRIPAVCPHPALERCKPRGSAAQCAACSFAAESCTAYQR